jgi:hypothetical protein
VGDPVRLSIATKRFSIEPHRKLIWMKVTLSLALGCGFVLSRRLWVSSRQFPLAPVSDYLPVIPFPFDYACLFLLLGLLSAIIILAQPRRLILIFIALAGLLALFDQTRWQPWFYQYLFMMAALGFYAWKKPEAKSSQAALNSCRLIVACTYIWSGLQKLNFSFISETWPGITEPILPYVPEAVKDLPTLLILLVPLLEILTGVGLLTRKYRNASVILAIGTHFFILLMLTLASENTVVWPWNIAMALFVTILFWQDAETGPGKILLPKSVFQGLVFILFAILPAFSFVGLWDSYLSSALYSGNTYRGVIYISNSLKDRLPANLHQYLWQRSEPIFLDINKWAYGELNVPAYPEPRVYRKITEHICSYADGPSDVYLGMKEKPNPLNGVRAFKYYDCDHLGY